MSLPVRLPSSSFSAHALGHILHLHLLKSSNDPRPRRCPRRLYNLILLQRRIDIYSIRPSQQYPHCRPRFADLYMGRVYLVCDRRDLSGVQDGPVQEYMV